MPVLFVLFLCALLPARAAAQEAQALRVAGDITVLTDDRLRGVSQSNLRPAIGGGLSLDHRSGVFFTGTLSTVAGWGSVGGAPVRLQLSGGYRSDLGDARVAARVTGTLFPGSGGSYVELGGSVSGFMGPLSLTGSLAWAPPQEALGNWSGTPESRPGTAGSNLYLAADAGVAVLGTPLTLIGHVGRSQGSEGLGPNGWALSPTGAYWDWRLGFDCGFGPLTLGLAWVATDIDTGSLAWRQLQPAFSANGGASPGASRLVASLTFAF